MSVLVANGHQMIGTTAIPAAPTVTITTHQTQKDQQTSH